MERSCQSAELYHAGISSAGGKEVYREARPKSSGQGLLRTHQEQEATVPRGLMGRPCPWKHPAGQGKRAVRRCC